MPSPITININCPLYHIRFMESVYGAQPIVFPRRDNFSLLLNYLLEKRPDEYVISNYGDNNLAIQLPYFEDKNVLYNYYLTPIKEQVIINKIDELFKVTFKSEMNECLLYKLSMVDSIHVFMDKFHIPEDNFDLLKKDYYRYRKIVRQKKYENKKKKLVS